MSPSESSRHTAGERVVVRYALPAPDERSGARFTDVVGTLVAAGADEIIVDSRRGRVVVPRSAVVATRVIPPRPSRRGAPHRALSVEDLERVMVGAWPPAEREQLGSWMLRAGDGFTSRANSALVVGQPDRPLADALVATEQWYALRGLPARLAIPLGPGQPLEDDEVGRLALGSGWLAGPPVAVLTAATRTALASAEPGAADTLAEVTLEGRMTDGWFGAYRRSREVGRGAAEAVLHGSPAQRFATARAVDGAVVGVGRLGVSDGWAGLGALWVEPDHRRSGVGLALVHALLDAAAELRCVSTHLQVEADNAAAMGLAVRLGFTEHHRYAYLTS